MATKIWAAGTGQDGNFAALFETAQSIANRTDGWTVAKVAAGNSAEFDAGTKQLSTTLTSQTTTPKPGSFLTGTTANAFKTPNAYTGTFVSGNWTVQFAVIATASGSPSGRMRVRVFKSSNASGASATELTSSTLVSNTATSISTASAETIGANFFPGALTLANEYLFFVVAWEITTASSSNSGDVVLTTSNLLAGTQITSPDFTPGAAAEVIPDVGMALTVT